MEKYKINMASIFSVYFYSALARIYRIRMLESCCNGKNSEVWSIMQKQGHVTFPAL